MTFDGIRVNHTRVQEASDEMLLKVGEIDDRMNRLESELEPLRSQWIGNAQEQYRVSKAKWDHAISEMRDLLARSAQTVSDSNTEYKNADARGAAQFEI